MFLEKNHMLLSPRSTYFMGLALLAYLCLTPALLTAAAIRMNLTQPYHFFVKPALDNDACGVFSFFAEKGIGNAQGYDEDCKVNVLQIYNREQNAIAMLTGFDENSQIGQLLDRIQGVDIAPIDNGVRGHFCVNGDLSLQYAAGFAYRHWLPLDFSIGLYLPFYSLELTNVVWRELTDPLLPADPDRRVKEYLTNNFFCNVEQLGDGLQLGGWKRSGLGDLTILVDWLRDFPQQKPMLKNVQLNAYFGPSIPTGKRADENKIFALAFGNDGSPALVFGGGFKLTWGDFVHAGVDIQLTHIFGNVLDRRIKTNVNQTEFLLLQKACTFKDYGMTQQFNVYLQAENFYRGWCVLADYQFTKHGDDRLSVISEKLSSEIANTSTSLLDWTAHYFIGKIGYDFGYNCEDLLLTPKFSLYAKVPFNGKNSALFTSVGAILAFQF